MDTSCHAYTCSFYNAVTSIGKPRELPKIIFLLRLQVRADESVALHFPHPMRVSRKWSQDESRRKLNFRSLSELGATQRSLVHGHAFYVSVSINLWPLRWPHSHSVSTASANLVLSWVWLWLLLLGVWLLTPHTAYEPRCTGNAQSKMAQN